jgi:hypothetical protein
MLIYKVFFISLLIHRGYNEFNYKVSCTAVFYKQGKSFAMRDDQEGELNKAKDI